MIDLRFLILECEESAWQSTCVDDLILYKRPSIAQTSINIASLQSLLATVTRPASRRWVNYIHVLGILGSAGLK